MTRKKKLLILGATSETTKMVITAENMGVETYVVDPFEDAPAKKYASVAIRQDCFDVEAICSIVNKYNIDGVLPGCADILIPIYEEVCRKTGKICYVNKPLVEVFNNKKGLKQALLKKGLTVIKEYSYNEVKKENFNRYPLFIKPVDNNSSKGMSIVYTKEQFEQAYQNALLFSKSKTVLIEEYKECDDFFVGYFVQNGNLEVVFSGDRFVIKQDGVGSITSGIIYPSKYEKLYYENVHDKMKSLFKDLNFNNGICAIQGFVENGEIMFYDPALRITGGQEYVLINYFTNLDELQNLVNFALHGTMSNDSEYKKCDSSFGGKYACNLTFSVKPCTIGRIEGIENARNKAGVLNVTQEHIEGDVIDKIGTAQQNIARMHLVAENAQELCNLIEELQTEIQVFDVNGENVMIEGLDSRSWLEGVN